MRSFLRFLPVFFPVFTRQISRYPPHKIRKTSSKGTLKPNPSKIETGSEEFLINNLLLIFSY
ncbi:hypothetical protein DW107_08895 [Tannerella sp. AM09-19]|nr:hypothetical protein DW107_08895 [Tannerella sp. AM09-19]